MNKKKRMVEIKGFDGSSVTIEIDSNYSMKKWREGKCWAIWCDNPFYFIHFNRNGRATHAYCFHVNAMLPPIGQPLVQRGQKWCHIEKGKLIVDKEKK